MKEAKENDFVCEIIKIELVEQFSKREEGEKKLKELNLFNTDDCVYRLETINPTKGDPSPEGYDMKQIFIDGDFNNSYEARVQRSKKRKK